MKKLLLFASFLAIPFFGNGQTVIFEDSFETYDDFAIANVGNWTLTDVDQSIPYGITGITFANSGVPKSFQVFNSTTTTPPMTVSSTSDWSAKTGQKAMVCFAAVLPADGGNGPNNDWLISPQIQLSSEINTLSFWAKACNSTYSAEKFRVYVSTTGTDVSSFSPLSAITTTQTNVNWKEYTYNLSAYTGKQVYIAIQCTSVDQFGFAIDDFKVISTPLPTVAPSCTTLTAPANSATEVSINPVLTWAQATGAESYDVYLDTNPNPTTLIGNSTTTSFTVSTSLNKNTVYYWKVIPKNTIGAATGCSINSFTTVVPAYCSAGATSTSFEKITNVTFADINNNSTSGAGYEDFTSVVGNVKAGSTYTFTASFTGTSYTEDHVLVWIDLNNDKDFDDAGEQVLVTPTGKSPWTGSITIPATATVGQTRMRVRLNDSGSTSSNLTPCGTATFGQVEDYTLSIGTMAVSNAEKVQAKVYPNPVKDVLNIESTSKVKSLSVFDLSGKAVSSHTLNAVKSQVNLSKLAPGVYIVNIETENGKQSVKVVKE